MEGPPKGLEVDIDKIREEMMKVTGVLEIHDLHLWSINSNRFALSAHIVSSLPSVTLREATGLCKKYKIYHTTL